MCTEGMLKDRSGNETQTSPHVGTAGPAGWHAWPARCACSTVIRQGRRAGARARGRACSTVIMDTSADMGMDAAPMAASVAVMAISMTCPIDSDRPCACGRTQCVNPSVVYHLVYYSITWGVTSASLQPTHAAGQRSSHQPL